MSGELVLVTGGTGFVATHCMLHLLKAGYQVRTTRALARARNRRALDARGDRPFSEKNRTDPNGRGLSTYVKSKILAERAAWDFMSREGGAMELSVVNPVAIFGPVLGPDFSTSIQIVQRMLKGGMPRCPRIAFGIVDARDVADLHLRAMLVPPPKAKGF